MIKSLNDAASLLAQAKDLEKAAVEYRKAAREYILTHSEDPGWTPDPQGSKTWLYDTDAGTISVTRPESKEIPAHFDHDRVDEFYEMIADLFPEAVPLAFRTRIVREFSEEGYLAAVKQQPQHAAEMHSLIEKYIVPASEGKPLSPRVEVR